MIFILCFCTLITIIPIITSFKMNNDKRLCKNCKWFIPHKNPDMSEYGLCKIFKNVIPDKNGERIIYDYADHCRINDDMCGETGYLFEPKNLFLQNLLNEIDKKMKILQNKYNVIDYDALDKEIEKIYNHYNEVNERLFVEIIEKEEIKEIDEEKNYLWNIISVLQEQQKLYEFMNFLNKINNKNN